MNDCHVIGFVIGFVVALVISVFVNIIEPNNITYHKAKIMEYSCEFNGFKLENMETGDFIRSNEEYECSDGNRRILGGFNNDELEYIYKRMREE